MRDILLTLVLVGGLPVGLARPFFGAMMFAWVSVMNPHRLTWGFAYGQQWALAYAAVTLTALFLHEPKLIGDSIRRYWPIVLYVAWMGVTTTFADYPHGAQYRMSEVFKVHVMCLVTLCLLSSEQRVRWLLWIVTASIAFFGVKGGLFTITTGGGGRVWGPPNSMITDNNHLASALVFFFPVVYWVFMTVRKRWQQLGLAACMVLMVISVLGSQSRGALLAISAMALFLVMRTRHKLTALVAVGVIALIALPIMPDTYWNRIETIGSYEEDQSTQGRFNTWTTAFHVANARLTGGGFDYYGGKLFLRHAPNPDRADGSHSIYFQALGEHGWVGLALFLTILATFWLRCVKVRAWAAATPGKESWELLARLLQASLVGFLVNGAFIHIGNWDGFYFVFVALTALTRIADLESAPTRAAPRVGAAAARARGASVLGTFPAATAVAPRVNRGLRQDLAAGLQADGAKARSATGRPHPALEPARQPGRPQT